MYPVDNMTGSVLSFRIYRIHILPARLLFFKSRRRFHLSSQSLHLCFLSTFECSLISRYIVLVCIACVFLNAFVNSEFCSYGFSICSSFFSSCSFSRVITISILSSFCSSYCNSRTKVLSLKVIY